MSTVESNVIESLSVSRLTTSELIDTSSQLISITQTLAEQHAFIARQSSALDLSIGALVDIERTPLGSDRTEMINSDDAQQDMLVALIEDHLEAGAKTEAFFPEKASACKVLLSFYGNRDRETLMRGSLRDQGVEMRALLADLLDPSQDENRTASGCEPMIQKLNEVFLSLQKNREARNNEGNLPTSTTEQKRILRYRIDKLLSFIDVNIIDGIEGFDTVKTPVNELITEVMSEYRARVTRKANANN